MAHRQTAPTPDKTGRLLTELAPCKAAYDRHPDDFKPHERGLSHEQ